MKGDRGGQGCQAVLEASASLSHGCPALSPARCGPDQWAQVRGSKEHRHLVLRCVPSCRSRFPLACFCRIARLAVGMPWLRAGGGVLRPLPRFPAHLGSVQSCVIMYKVEQFLTCPVLFSGISGLWALSVIYLPSGPCCGFCNALVLDNKSLPACGVSWPHSAPAMLQQSLYLQLWRQEVSGYHYNQLYQWVPPQSRSVPGTLAAGRQLWCRMRA